MTYSTFLSRKQQHGAERGFAPEFLPPFLFDFQRALVDWACRTGRAAIFADTGLGKTPMQLVWAQNVVQHTGRPVLILTPLAVAAQTCREGEKFGIECRRHGAPGDARIVVANYDRLHQLDAADYAGVVCDESAILKHFRGATQKQVTRFMSHVPYRLLCTATPSPNDYIELGTASEALGNLGYADMLTRFFRQTDDKGKRRADVMRSHNTAAVVHSGAHFAKLALRDSQSIGQWRMKGHAQIPFWRWVATWARAARKPSDVGPFDDARFVLLPLVEREHIVEPKRPADGLLFVLPAFGLREEREERRRTLQERCALVARLVDHDKAAVVWCHMNDEGDLLERMIPGAIQVAGADSDDVKEERYEAFASGAARVLVTKPKCAAWGLNWQHCAHVVTFASHSFEQHYQSVRRCWRFGQTQPVTVDIVSTTGEEHLRANLARKSAAADAMFTEIISHMRDAQGVAPEAPIQAIEVPQWLSPTR